MDKHVLISDVVDIIEAHRKKSCPCKVTCDSEKYPFVCQSCRELINILEEIKSNRVDING